MGNIWLKIRYEYRMRIMPIVNILGVMWALVQCILTHKKHKDTGLLAAQIRAVVREHLALSPSAVNDSIEDSFKEIAFLHKHHKILYPFFAYARSKRVLYSGQAYYNAWYLSRGLRTLGWKADVLNWDTNAASQIYYHGEDFHFKDMDYDKRCTEELRFYCASIYAYDIFHFSNMGGICFGWAVLAAIKERFGEHSEITLLKKLGKIIVYTNNGCLDGVSQTAFSQWGPASVCSICPWQDNPNVCSDEKNLAWGAFRNQVADYQCLLGGNRVDYNHAPTVHESPEFYCLDKTLWRPDIEIPEAFRFPAHPKETLWLYHAIGNKASRTNDAGVNIKSSHVYLPLINRLKAEGMMLELCSPENVPNRDVRYLQAQCDIFLDMLTFGWFGANVREAMMLGKPAICFIRPEWLESLRNELPDYAAELPIISATPDTVETVLRDLISNPEKRHDIGMRGRIFAEKWHASDAAATRFDVIYSKLLKGDKQLVKAYA